MSAAATPVRVTLLGLCIAAVQRHARAVGVPCDHLTDRVVDALFARAAATAGGRRERALAVAAWLLNASYAPHAVEAAADALIVHDDCFHRARWVAMEAAAQGVEVGS